VFNDEGSGPFDASPQVPTSAKILMTLVERKIGIMLKLRLSQGSEIKFAIGPPDPMVVEDDSVKQMIAALQTRLIQSPNPHLQIVPKQWMRLLAPLITPSSSGNYINQQGKQSIGKNRLSILDIGEWAPLAASTYSIQCSRSIYTLPHLLLL
jgi:hypothetical protein